MANEIAFENSRTGEIKSVKVGWSWTLFFFGPLFGIPFFLRKAYTLAYVMLAWDAICIVFSVAGGFDQILSLGGLIISLMLGLQGNQQTANYYLRNGWHLADPESEETQMALSKWGLAQ